MVTWQSPHLVPGMLNRYTMMYDLLSILKEELQIHRTFLSSDEESALGLPISRRDADDLAFERVQRRRRMLYSRLRDRFIREGQPAARWRRFIAEDETLAGETTTMSQLATQVLEWAARTSDRGAMIGGFAAKTLRWAALALFLVGGFALLSGSRGAGLGLVLGALALWVAGRVAASLVAQRVELLNRAMLYGPLEERDPEGP